VIKDKMPEKAWEIRKASTRLWMEGKWLIAIE